MRHLILLAVLQLASPAAAQAPEDLDRLRDRALELVNQSRAKAGLPALSEGRVLDEAAQGHAEDMLARDYYAHRTPEGRGPRDRYLAAGGSEARMTAENIARCSGCGSPDITRVEELHEGWMNSPGHRENILSEGLSHFGFGMVASGRESYAVQTFAGPGTARGESGEPVDTQAAAKDVLDRLNRARREAGAPALALSDGLVTAATRLLPESLGSDARLGDIGAAIPTDEQRNWSSVSAVSGLCGGCGTTTTEGDVITFLADWLESDSYTKRLLDPAVSHMGAALRADGEGRKVMVLVLGDRR